MKLSFQSLVVAASLGFMGWGVTPLYAQDTSANANAVGGEALTSRRRIDHSNAVWTALFRSERSSRQESFLLDRLSFSRSRQNLGLSEVQTADWTLGLGEDAAHFATTSANSRWEKSLKNHQVAVTLGLEGALYVESAAYQNLQAQYLLDQEQAVNDGLPGQGLDRSLEWGGVIRLEDVYRASPSLDIKVNVETRHNRFELDEQRRETSELVSGGAGFSKRWSRINWDTSAQRYQLVFRDQNAPGQAERRQGLASLDSTLSTALAGRLRLGLGYQSYTSTFTDSPTRSIHGPAVSLAREANDRLAWALRFSVLRETGNTDREGQSFGSLNLSYRLSPRSNLVLIVSKEVDLLRYYQSYTADRLVLDGEQQYTLQQSLQWQLLTGRSRWSLQYVRSEQRFAGILVDNASLGSVLTWKVSRISELTQQLEVRRDQAADATVGDGTREVYKASHAYRYFWGGGASMPGARPYGSLALDYEQLRDAENAFTFERFTLVLGLGQEWLL